MTTDFALLENRETAVSAETLNLKQLHAALTERGVGIGYTTLSQFFKSEEVSEILDAGGTGNRREFLPDVVDILAAFFPEFKAAGGKMPQAPAMLRSFVKQPRSTLVPTTAHDRSRDSLRRETAADPVALAEAQGRAQGLAMGDLLLDAAGAAAYVKVSRRTLRRHFPPSFRIGASPVGDRWRVSDLLAGPRR